MQRAKTGPETDMMEDGARNEIAVLSYSRCAKETEPKGFEQGVPKSFLRPAGQPESQGQR